MIEEDYIEEKEFRSKLGLTIDRPKPGYRSINDGNTARRFSENSVVFDNRVGRLIKHFYVILPVISSDMR